MTNIEKLRISLMEKTGEFKTDDGEIKSSCTVKATTQFRFNEYIDSTFNGANEEERETILSGVSDKIFGDLLEASKHLDFNHVGIWLTIGEQVYENSISIAVMEGIQQHGEKGIVPIFELIKMSLPNEL